VVVISKDEVAITTGSECMMEFVRIGPSNEMFALRSCEVTIEFSSVSVMDDESMLVGTIDDTRPVRVISLQGEERHLDVSFPAKKYPVRHSACTYLRNCDKVVITDRYDHAVFIYDVATNTSIEIRDKKVMMEPRGVAVGPDDTIFVCSSKTNTLIEISHTGEILASHKVDMLYTCRVCMSKDNSRVAVTNACVGDKRLQIFEIAEIC
jgi:DNA-binding beta-propeller fold protein YncE